MAEPGRDSPEKIKITPFVVAVLLLFLIVGGIGGAYA